MDPRKPVGPRLTYGRRCLRVHCVLRYSAKSYFAACSLDIKFFLYIMFGKVHNVLCGADLTITLWHYFYILFDNHLFS